MKRLALLSPLSPAPTGIADYSVELAALLSEDYALDVFHGGQATDETRLPKAVRVHPAARFLALARERPYDLALYQMGNGLAHAFLYDLLARVPGLLVLHDLVLHHSRARMFLESEEALAYRREPWSAARRDAAREQVERYRAEVEYAYPGRGARLVAAQLETVGPLLPYAYPLFRIPVEASRLTLVHNAFMASAVSEEVPQARVVRVPHHAPAVSVAPATLAELRRRHGLEEGEIVVGVFGLLTPEKRIETVARAVARAAQHVPRLRFLLVGASPAEPDLERLLSRLGLGQRAVVAGRVAWDDLGAYMTLPDIAVQLRYPTARETSGALLRTLAQGRPVIVSDLAHQGDLPDDAVIRADLGDEEGAVTRAILRLAANPGLRERLGRNARAFAEREHAPARTRAGYIAAIEEAAALPNPPAREWPAHWREAAGQT